MSQRLRKKERRRNGLCVYRARVNLGSHGATGRGLRVRGGRLCPPGRRAAAGPGGGARVKGAGATFRGAPLRLGRLQAAVDATSWVFNGLKLLCRFQGIPSVAAREKLGGRELGGSMYTHFFFLTPSGHRSRCYECQRRSTCREKRRVASTVQVRSRCSESRSGRQSARKNDAWRQLYKGAEAQMEVKQPKAEA